MCITCWRDEYGSPKIINENVARLILATEAVYRYNSAGGCLHVVLDDMNIEDNHIHLEHLSPNCDSLMQKAAEEMCLDQLKLCTVEERASALALIEIHGFANINYWEDVTEDLFESVLL